MPRTSNWPRAHAVEAEDWQTLSNLLEQWLAEGQSDLYRRVQEYVDRLVLCRTLQHADGNQTRAAEILGLSRVTLRTKLRSMQLGVEKAVTVQSREQPT